MSTNSNKDLAMEKNEKTSKTVASIAAKALYTGKASPAEIRRIAASALTQRANEKKRK